MIRFSLNRSAAIACSLAICCAAAWADRTLCSTGLPLGKPERISPEIGEALLTKDVLRFSPAKNPKTVSVELPLPQNRDFRLYSELAFETSAWNDATAVTVELQSIWPKYDKLAKNGSSLKRGNSSTSCICIRPVTEPSCSNWF